ncbi:hypothetical protein BU15DRAFT_47730 [Melanogaster broomeanus]|nr:hypothetical protein BU15DRAFT_47730 [Melanogaster broomeanus]
MLSRELPTTYIPTTLKTWFARVTWSRITLSFFLIALANGIAQATVQTITSLSVSAKGRDLVSDVIDAAGVQRGFVVVQGNVVMICSGIPTISGATCKIAYNGSISDDQAGDVTRREFQVLPVIYNTSPSAMNVSILDTSAPPTTVSVQCAESLTWLESFLRDVKSEDVAHMVFQVWLFTLSLFALIDQSIPHLIVVLVAQILNTGWAGFRIYTDIAAKHTYDQLIVNGACGGVDILGGWWADGMRYVILGINVGVLLCMIFPVYKLVNRYSKETFSSVGSSPIVNRVLKWTLWMSVSVQFTAFFTMASAAIWFDKRRTDIIPTYSRNMLYDAAFVVVAVLFLPWLCSGSYSIRYENRRLFALFVILSMVLLVITGLWFGSPVFRYELDAWTFFAAVTTTAACLLIITCVLALVCRVHFGLGLAQFRDVKKELQESGFAQDTFVHDPNSTLPTVALKSNSSSRLSLSRSPSALYGNASMSSEETLAPPGSARTVDSGVFRTWVLASKKLDEGGGDEEKGHVLGHGQRQRAAPRPLLLPMSRDGNENDRSRGTIVRESVVLGRPTKEADYQEML